jgi:adenine-specific DNA-methyltransferase
MPRKTTVQPSKPVESIVHSQDKRTNIPTRELRGFVREEDLAPSTALYPRDTALDPQLVWRGKDQQDDHSLRVPVVPIYIQEKISPVALIEDLRVAAQQGKPRQTTLFADFNGIKFDQMVDFYHHEQNWTNRMILGDSLLAMTSLAEKESLKGKVQMIYIDPPYGIKFSSNWQVSTRNREMSDGKPQDLTRQPEQVKAFRDTWELGIHSYLAYLRDRLVVSRELLTESGSVFVQIGDANVHLVRCLLDEVFGRENFVCQIAFQKTAGQSSNYLSNVYDHLVWFAKDKEVVKFRRLYREKFPGEEGAEEFNKVELANGEIRPASKDEISDPKALAPGARLFATYSLFSQGESKAGPRFFDFEVGAERFRVPCPPGYHFKTSEAGLRRWALANRVLPHTGQRILKRYLDDFRYSSLTNYWSDTRGEPGMVYVVQTSTKVIERCLLMTTDPGDLVLDPTCGSGTGAFVAEKWGRRWITIDSSRVALSIARARMMGASYPYFLLTDSVRGIRKLSDLGSEARVGPAPKDDIRKGFVLEQTPRVELEDIAHNELIVDGMSGPEIRSAIDSRAQPERLIDCPYQDSSTVRVSGPFTMESLSPHRTVSPVGQGERPSDEEIPATSRGADFARIILDNLRKAGVQNSVKGERLNFTRLDPYPGTYINAEGEYVENGESKRAAVCIGPEYGTVGPDLVKEAAKEAVVGRGFDCLVVCGFAFDPYVGDEAKQFGRLSVLNARMNPDLAMGEELLKKTGAGNLFMVFGEPDMTLTEQEDGRWVVELRGLDVYDPTTGQVRSHSTDDIACWFVDTDYNGESFFVRHAYFCGTDQPYDRLKRALRAEVDESAWTSLYSTKSRPFEKPKTGRIAVKVINHFGDEVLKVSKIG